MSVIVINLSNFLHQLYNALLRHLNFYSTQKKFCWKRDKHDERDYYIYWISKSKMPVKIDLRTNCPDIYDQGQLGSCTANAICGAYEYDEIKDYGKKSDVLPSRLFLYYNERKIEGTVSYDSGATLRDGMKSIVNDGICTEQYWPYDIYKYNVEPPSNCYENATKNKALQYTRLYQQLSQLQTCLANGFPFVFGIKVYDSFESKEVQTTGIVPMPNITSERFLGGHALMAIGYDVEKKYFIIRNSWGVEWGDNGYCYIPFDYLIDRNLASDFWYVGKVMSPNKNVYTIYRPPVFC
jgi:C1A family cysteine protease